jgi:hypothetical protein
MSESESSCQLSNGSKVSEEPVANIKEESKEDKDFEEIDPNFRDVRLVHYFLFTVNIKDLIKAGFFWELVSPIEFRIEAERVQE